MEVWHIWAIVALLFIILEIFTSGFAVMCFSFGGIAAAIAAGCDASLTWQIVWFCIFTAIAFVTVRPFVLRTFFKDEKKTVKTNVDALVGRQARVTEPIDPKAGTGRVAVDGDDWKAETEDDSCVEKGEKVEIVKVDSVIVTVKRIQ